MRFICPKITGCTGEVPPHTPEKQAMPYAEHITAFSDTRCSDDPIFVSVSEKNIHEMTPVFRETGFVSREILWYLP
jgi:hypothetical protein